MIKPEQLGPLHNKIRELMALTGTPGVAVGLWYEGEEHLAGFGVTNVNHPLAVDGDTLFQIGSTTKTFTATVAMRLVEEGKLDLDTPIRTYLPTFRLQDRKAQEQATLRHCFTHMGGWLGDHFDDTGDGDDALARYVESLAEIPQITPLGTLWSYNNAGLKVAGRVIEVVTSQPYEQVVRQVIFQPLGMEHTCFFAKEAITQRVAVGHNVLPEQGAQVTEPWALARNSNPTGGIISTARDQLRYARFHLGDGRAADGGRLLQAESLRTMQTPWANAGNMADAVGVSWLLDSVGGVQTVAHGGATNGQMSAFLLVPARHFAITVLTNANRGRELHSKLAPWALEHLLALSNPQPVIQPRGASELSRYAGRYVARLTHLEVSVVENGLLVKTIPQGGFPYKDSPPGPAQPPSTLAFVTEEKLIFVDGPLQGGRAEVIYDTDGSVAWLRVGGRIHRYQGRD